MHLLRRAGPMLALLAAFVAPPTFAAEAQPPLTPAESLAQINGDDPPQVLDVRTPEEFAEGHVPGAVLIPHDQLAARIAELDRERPVLVYCRSGRRSTLAETQLLEAGFDVRQIDGSWLRWTAEGLPMETSVATDTVPAIETPNQENPR